MKFVLWHFSNHQMQTSFLNSLKGQLKFPVFLKLLAFRTKSSGGSCWALYCLPALVMVSTCQEWLRWNSEKVRRSMWKLWKWPAHTPNCPTSITPCPSSCQRMEQLFTNQRIWVKFWGVRGKSSGKVLSFEKCKICFFFFFRIVNTPYEVTMAEDISCRLLCHGKDKEPMFWNAEDSIRIIERIQHEYTVHLWVFFYVENQNTTLFFVDFSFRLIDNLPAATKKKYTKTTMCSFIMGTDWVAWAVTRLTSTITQT